MELHISPLTKGEPPTGEQLQLPLDGATGERHPFWASAANGPMPMGFEEDEAVWNECEPLRLEENTDYEVVIIVPLDRTLLVTRAKEHKAFPFADERLDKSLTISLREGISTLGDGRLRVLGRLRFDNALGTADLSLHPECGVLSLKAEVSSNKLDYANDFPFLLSSLSRIHAEIILSLDSVTATELAKDGGMDSTPQSALLTLRWALQEDRIPLAVATILGNPMYRLKSFSEIESASHVKSPDFVQMLWRPEECDWIKGGPLVDFFRGYTPATLHTFDIHTTYDTAENRFVKYALKELAQLTRSVGEKLRKQHGASKRWLYKQCERLDEFLNNPLWEVVGECTHFPASMVLYERLGYRDFFQYISVLQLAVGFSDDPRDADPTGDLREIWELYEIWGFFQLREVMEEVAGVAGSPSLKSLLDKSDYTVGVKTGEGSAVKFEWEVDGTSVIAELFHTRLAKPLQSDLDSWSNSYSTEYKPDYSVKITIKSECHWLHFDAKYRANFVQRKQVGDLGGNGSPEEIIRWVRAEDVAVMHSYRDSLLGSRGCYVLYPGNTERGPLYVRHGEAAYRRNFVIPSVGAFPLCPNSDLLKLQRRRISQHIRSAIRNLIECHRYQEELGVLRENFLNR